MIAQSSNSFKLMLDEPGRHQWGPDPKKTCAYKDAHAANKFLKTGKKTVPTISLGHSWHKLEQFYEGLKNMQFNHGSCAAGKKRELESDWSTAAGQANKVNISCPRTNKGLYEALWCHVDEEIQTGKCTTAAYKDIQHALNTQCMQYKWSLHAHFANK